MYTTTGEKLTWAEYNARWEQTKNIFIGNYPKEDSERFLAYAHKHTKKEFLEFLDKEEANLDFMYVDGRPRFYDEWRGEVCGVRCKDGWLWN